jgi:hypothetical protein
MVSECNGDFATVMVGLHCDLFIFLAGLSVPAFGLVLLAELGGDITVQQQGHLVRGRLVLNTIRGTDKGTPSAKALGSEKRVSMWRVEVQERITVLSPATLQDPEVRERLLEAAG